MTKDIILNYSNEDFLEKVRKHNLEVAKTGKGKFQYNAVFIDLNAEKNYRLVKKLAFVAILIVLGALRLQKKDIA